MAVNGNVTTISIETAVPGTFQEIGGMDTSGITWGGAPIVTTNKSTGGFATYADFSGAKEVVVSGNIIYDNDVAMQLVDEHLDAGGLVNYKLTRGDGKELTAAFVIQPSTETSPHNASITRSFAINSSGVANWVTP